MPDTKTRRLAAERILQSLEIQVEQYRFHLEGVAAQPHEAEKARAMLDKIARELEWQRKYCELLGNADPDLPAKNGSRVA